MKLLFGQNLSSRLVQALQDLYPGSAHVKDVGLESADDAAVWEHAKEHGFTIASKDFDFWQFSFTLGQPPKVVWVQLGNCTTSEVEAVLRYRYHDLVAFEEDEGKSFLTLRP